MLILIERSSNKVVKYFGNNEVNRFDTKGLSYLNKFAPMYNTVTHHLLSIDKLPANYEDECYTFDGVTWNLVNNELYTAINSKKAQPLASSKKAEFKRMLEVEGNADVTYNGSQFNGGQDSAQAMLIKSEAGSVRGRPNISVFDKDNQMHVLTGAEIKELAAEISDQYEVAFMKYQIARGAVDQCGDDLQCIQSVEWGN